MTVTRKPYAKLRNNSDNFSTNAQIDNHLKTSKKLSCKEEGEKVGMKVARAIMKPGSLALDAHKVSRIGPIIGIPGLFAGLGCLGVSVIGFAGGYVAGSTKAKIQQIIQSEKSNIRHAEEEQIVLKRK